MHHKSAWFATWASGVSGVPENFVYFRCFFNLGPDLFETRKKTKKHRKTHTRLDIVQKIGDECELKCLVHGTT